MNPREEFLLNLKEVSERVLDRKLHEIVMGKEYDMTGLNHYGTNPKFTLKIVHNTDIILIKYETCTKKFRIDRFVEIFPKIKSKEETLGRTAHGIFLTIGFERASEYNDSSIYIVNSDSKRGLLRKFRNKLVKILGD